MRSPTWSELGTHDHPGSVRLIFYPEGHTYGCRTPDFWNSNRGKSGYWTKRFIMLSPYMLLVFGKAQEGTYVLPIGCAVHQNRKIQILSICLTRRHLRSPTWSELGTRDHPGSARLIFYPEGHTYGCRTPDFLNSIRCKPGRILDRKSYYDVPLCAHCSWEGSRSHACAVGSVDFIRQTKTVVLK